MVAPAVTRERRAILRWLCERQSWCCIWCEFSIPRNNIDARAIINMEAPPGPYITIGTFRRAAEWIKATFDHVVPRAKGGSYSIRNGLAACLWCNNWRGTEDPETFKVRVMALIAEGLHPRQIFRATGQWKATFPEKIEVAA